nr:uncharacterized protein LOC111506052 [Leptinotarsa decemlineata]
MLILDLNYKTRILKIINMKFVVSKYVCCSMIDLTIACRIIASIGLTISIWLVVVLINDKFWREDDYYDLSRKTALALGLDWQHFHAKAAANQQDDPEGRMISIIVLFYSAAFLIINILLFFGTIIHNSYCAMPWLLCELLGCISKLGALIYHLHCDHLNRFFFVGSIVYIVLMVWWWTVVFLAQLSWRRARKCDFELEMSSVCTMHPVPNEQKGISRIHVYRNSVTIDSPDPYQPNKQYSPI